MSRVLEQFRRSPQLRSKSSLRLVSEVFGPTDWEHGPGDDTAVIECGNQLLLLGGEAIWPAMVMADPFGAGVASVVANVNDVTAMGGRAIALVNQVVAAEGVARQVLEGVRFAANLYGVSVAGGHLTIWGGPPSVAASMLGRVHRPLSSVNVAPAQALLLACCLEGEMRKDFPFFSSIRQRGEKLAGDVEVLPRLAEAGLCSAAKDVSMAGILGSAAMLLEPTRSGAEIDLGALPTPDEVTVEAWTSTFPTYAFLIVTPFDQVETVRADFVARGLECEQIGTTNDSGRLRARFEGEEEDLLDLNSQSVTGLRRKGASAPAAGDKDLKG